MVPVKRMELVDLPDGRQRLTVEFDDPAHSVLCVYGDLYAEALHPLRDELVSWRLVFNARAAAGVYTWGRHTVTPPSRAGPHPPDSRHQQR